ncbi:gastrula zinc finger protein xFG20-1-like [Phycodurus eques]|uniref:gastrula zinc finger protein xFG20-1-like n=1 Tax=Phycodurus eques TaxID=693459 RepID=UPI002ACEEBDE|nr:gastrula zinc finger protein xFG20-1-like [Phycodurus eques]
MLKELVRERLIAAADEIFGLFEKTIASYEEELCRAREENEQQRQQLEAVCKTQIVLRVEDVQQLIGHPPQQQLQSSCLDEEHPQPPCVNEEDPQPLHVKEEEEDPEPLHVKDEEAADVSNLPLTGFSTQSENEAELSQLPPRSPSGDHRGGPPLEDLFAPLSDSDNMEETYSSVVEWKGQKKKTKQKRQKCFACSVCGERFVRRQNMLRHKRTHVGGKSFSQKPLFTAHRGKHTDERHFRCPVCGKTFKQKSRSVSHMRMHTGEKPYSCSVCGKTFSRKDSIGMHMRTHTGEKPFACTVCGKTFTHKSNTVMHMRTHTGEKPFSCSNCGQAFHQKSHLESHMRTYTGKKSFCCSVCGNRFTCRPAFTTHIRTHNTEGVFDAAK